MVPTGRGRDDRRARSRRNEDKGAGRPQEQRQHRRHSKRLKAKVFKRGKAGKKTVEFEATIESRDISVGGVFLESTFFLKKGVKIEVEFTVPEIENVVHVAGEVVYIIAEARNKNEATPTGFAIRFDKFFGDSEIVLRAFLTRGDVYEFVNRYAQDLLPKLGNKAQPKLVEFIMRWEIYQESLE